LELAEKVQKVYKNIYKKNIPISKGASSNQIFPKYKIENKALLQLGFSPAYTLEKGIENLFNYF
jgi:nucleoside-diphosphate-sugar epimerase